MNTTWENTLDPFPSVRGAAFASFTTLQDISPVSLPQLSANELKLGSKLELEAWGELSNTGTPTLQLAFLLGVAAAALASTGVTLAASGAIATTTGAASWPWHMKWMGLVTATGATGSIYGSGELELPTSLTAPSPSFMPVTAAARAVAIDTTVAKTLGVGAAWGASSASNIVRVDHFTAKIINQGKAG